MATFDGYSATLMGARHEDVIPILFGPSDTYRVGKGFHQFGRRATVTDVAGESVGAVQWGGRQGDRVMLEVKGSRTPSVVANFRHRYPDHRCTRVDSCEDFFESGIWERALGVVLDVKQRFKLKGERRGDWDYPEDGRTQYLGAVTSPVRARLYEKGKEPGYRHLKGFTDWVRLELQVRPEKEAKTVYSALSATEVWGASPFSRELAGALLNASVGRVPAGTVFRESQRDRALRFMCRQYGAHLVSLASDLGDWQSVGLTLSELVKAERGKGTGET